MLFQGSVLINKPRELVVRLFQDPNNLKEYQDGFVSKELTSGVMGQDGAVSAMLFRQGKREMAMTETITSNRLPDTFEAFYHHKHMDNTMKCTFTPVSDSTTRYDYEFEYTRVSWVVPRLMMMLFPGMFRKQGEKWMMQFKQFVERQA